MHCLTCDAEKHPSIKFTNGGIVEACPTCETVFSRHVEAAPAVQAVAAAPPVPAAVAPVPAAPRQWGDLLDEARARLAVCEAEIEARDGFIAERDMLRRMLAAADGETRPAPRSVFTN